jgi:hypothetical protein
MNNRDLTFAMRSATNLKVNNELTHVRVSPTEVLAVFLSFAVMSAMLSYAMGRDLNWDYFNYHGYAVFDVFGTRLDHDLFPAGMQGHLNRLAYLPMALMESAGWHSALTAAVLAALQSTNLLFLYLIAREISAGSAQPRAQAAVITLLGAASNVFILQLGSSFVDPLTTPPVMAAVWILLCRTDQKALFGAGILCGAAVALKLTNAPFAAGLLVAAGLGGASISAATYAMLLAGTGLGLGFALLYAHWGWKLVETHGSPVFPLFNNLFRAPDFATESVSFHRFVPQSFLDALSLPFRMAQFESWIYSEVPSPDLRPAVLVMLVFALSLATAFRIAHRRPVISKRDIGLQASGLQRLVVFFCVSLVGWLLTSANGRYATPLLLLLGPLIYTAAARLLGLRPAGMLCLVTLCIQVFMIADVGNPRWNASDWRAQWLTGSVPAELKAEPQLFLSIGHSSESFVAAYVHPESVFIAPIGLHPIPTDGPAWSRFTSLRDQYTGRTRILFTSMPLRTSKAREQRITAINLFVDRLGLTIDPNRCHELVFEEPDPDALHYLWSRDKEKNGMERILYACDAALATPSVRLASLRAQATEIMDAFERRCPEIFAPRQVQIEGDGETWVRNYGKFDLFLFVNFTTGTIHHHMMQQATDIVIGNVGTWRQDADRFSCTLPHSGKRDISTLNADANR